VNVTNVNLYPGSMLGRGRHPRFGTHSRGRRHGSALDQDAVLQPGIPRRRTRWPRVYTPDDLAAGVVPQGPVVVFDFDNYYLAGAIAEQLAKQVGDTTYVTTAGNASAWTFMTNELPLVHRALSRAGVPIRTLRRVTAFDGEQVTLADVYTGALERLACRSLVIVGMRKPRDELYQALLGRPDDLARAPALPPSLVSAIRWHPARSFTPYTAATVTPANSTRFPRSYRTREISRYDLPAIGAHAAHRLVSQ
jgi:dimethylamine/trimethylamine dehydrogenase